MKPEEAAQINYMAWMKHHYPQYAEDIHHFANERYLHDVGGSQYMVGKKLKRMGVTKGVSDIFVAIPRNGKAGLWLELKVGKNTLSTEQKLFLQRKREMGYEGMMVNGFESAIKETLSYLGINWSTMNFCS